MGRICKFAFIVLLALVVFGLKKSPEGLTEAQSPDKDLLRVEYCVGSCHEAGRVAVWATLLPDGTQYNTSCTGFDDDFIPLCDIFELLSPNENKWLAVVINRGATPSESTYDLQVRDARGRNPITLIPNPFPGRAVIFRWAWLPDNEHVLFWSDDTNDLFLLDTDSVTQTKLITVNDRRSRPGSTSDSEKLPLSPDSSQVLFQLDQSGALDLFVINTDGSGMTNLTNSPGDESACAHWSPVGSQIVFDYTPPSVAMATINVGTANARAERGTWSEAVNQFSYGTELEVLEREGGWTKVPNETGQEVWVFDDLLTFSTVAPKETIDIVNGDGSGRMTLSEGNYPVWSPDGSQIGFVCQNEGQKAICLINPDGSNLRVVVTGEVPNEYLSPPIWSPDGKRIAFGSKLLDGETYTFHIFDLAANEDHIVFDDNVEKMWSVCSTDGIAKWSSDSEWIMFYASDGAKPYPGTHYYVCNIDGCEEISNLLNKAVGESPIDMLYADWIPADWLKFRR